MYSHITNVDDYLPGVRLYHRSCAAVWMSTKGMINKEAHGHDEGWRGDLELCKRYCL